MRDDIRTAEMVTYRHNRTGEKVTLHTDEAIDRFFDNRCPFQWERV